MQKPATPPVTGNDTSSRFWQQLEAKLAPLETDYLHWHDLSQQVIPVQGINHKQWWQLLKAKRRARMQPVACTIGQQNFYWVLDDLLLQRMTQLEQQLAIVMPKQLDKLTKADRFIKEAVASVKLAGFEIQQQAAEDLLYAGYPARSVDEKAIEQLYTVMSEQLEQPLSAEVLLTWNRKLLDDENAGWRRQEYQIKRQQTELFKTPSPDNIEQDVIQLCAFANDEDNQRYMPPLLKAIILHYLMSHLHPFQAGNGRMARLLFYWQLTKLGYHSIEHVALSEVLALQAEDYYRAFLYSQSDSHDLTYFLMQQLQALDSAIVTSQKGYQQKIEQLMQLPEQLTLRQQHILNEMRQSPQRQYRLARYQQRMGITYETSRTDLRKLAKLGYAEKHKIGKAFVYSFKSL